MAPKTSFRFSIGSDVLCRTGDDEWSKGKVVALNYREKDWPKGQVVPYQVELDDGTLIFVPADVPQLCKMFVAPSWEQAVTEQDEQKLEAAISRNGCEETDHLGRSPLLSCVDVGWQEGALLLLARKADPCKGAGPEKCTPIHLAVMPLARVAFRDADMDNVKFSREEGRINIKVEYIDHEDVKSVSYDTRDGKLTWVDEFDQPSWSILPPPLRAWVPARLATLLEGTAVQTSGLPKAASRMRLVKALLEARADVNLQNEDPDNDLSNFTSTTYQGLEQREHRSALHYAAEAGELGVCASLLAARAKVDLEDRFKMTPLDISIEERSELVVDLLLRNAADPNRGNMRRGLQQTTLHQICDSGNAQILKLLTKHGGKVNAAGKQGMTPLHLAARKKRVEVVKVLLESGADIRLLDQFGRTPRDYALSNGNSALADALAQDKNMQLSDRIALLGNAEATDTLKHMEEEKRQALLKSLHAV